MDSLHNIEKHLNAAFNFVLKSAKVRDAEELDETVNVNVNVISRTALIRNRVSRRVCTCACHVWVSSIYFKRPKPISFPS